MKRCEPTKIASSRNLYFSSPVLRYVVSEKTGGGMGKGSLCTWSFAEITVRAVSARDDRYRELKNLHPLPNSVSRKVGSCLKNFSVRESVPRDQPSSQLLPLANQLTICNRALKGHRDQRIVISPTSKFCQSPTLQLCISFEHRTHVATPSNAHLACCPFGSIVT
jgi:hypothetical protein